MFKKLVLGLFFLCGFGIAQANANITLVVPSEAGTGTSIWATHVSKVLSEKLGEDVVLLHIGAAKGRVAIEKFNNEWKDNPDMIMLVHGGNANQWLIQDVSYNFRDWKPLLIQPYDVITTVKIPDLLSTLTNADAKIRIADCSGCIPESMAWGMLFGWDKLEIIKKMSPGAAKKAWLAGELFYIREPVDRHLKDTAHLVDDQIVVRFFNHGLLTRIDGKFIYSTDPNFANDPQFEELYHVLTGQKFLHSELYRPYFLAKAWRDGLQKGLFVHPNNPNYDRLVKAIDAMLNDPNDMAYLNEKLGHYPIYTGEDALGVMDYLYNLVNEEDLKALVKVAQEKLGWGTAVYLPNRVTK